MSGRSLNISLCKCDFTPNESISRNSDAVHTRTHNYYTRSSVKNNRTISDLNLSHSSTPISNQQNTRTNNNILLRSNEQQNREDTDDSINSDILPNIGGDLITVRPNKKLIMNLREYPNLGPCGQSYNCPTNKWLRPFSFFASIGLLALIMVYLNGQYHKSCNTMTAVTDEIQNIKKQVDGMKTDVNNVAKIRDETEKKLDCIEGMLKNIQEIQAMNEKQNQKCPSSPPENSEPCKSVVKEMLHEYDADKTGKTDFALESAGGSIVGTKDTENFFGASNTLTLFGVPLCESNNNPRAMLQPGMSPGQCWAFKGAQGTAVVKLLTSVHINGVSLEHISKSISPSGEISTAPKDFSVWGIFSPGSSDQKLLGQFAYDINGPALQHFPIEPSSPAFPYIEFKVHSNHGNSEFTCVYRLRVHGNI